MTAILGSVLLVSLSFSVVVVQRFCFIYLRCSWLPIIVFFLIIHHHKYSFLVLDVLFLIILKISFIYFSWFLLDHLSHILFPLMFIKIWCMSCCFVVGALISLLLFLLAFLQVVIFDVVLVLLLTLLLLLLFAMLLLVWFCCFCVVVLLLCCCFVDILDLRVVFGVVVVLIGGCSDLVWKHLFYSVL